MKRDCCNAFTKARKNLMKNDDGTWDAPGCCGGGCTILLEMKFCPFCGTKFQIVKKK